MSYQFYQNKECKYFPCHRIERLEDFNCLFCYCPLYALGPDCNGNFTYTEEGIKDCSGCVMPHCKENYEKILEKTQLVVELAKEKPVENP